MINCASYTGPTERSIYLVNLTKKVEELGKFFPSLGSYPKSCLFYLSKASTGDLSSLRTLQSSDNRGLHADKPNKFY